MTSQKMLAECARLEFEFIKELQARIVNLESALRIIGTLSEVGLAQIDKADMLKAIKKEATEALQ